ncbi:hypothetical protein EDB19DRAFT_2044018 [Suillus lakei]|nr:hypothetical protein EDB19DRAFT_2044018 [Suillus lakei]
MTLLLCAVLFCVPFVRASLLGLNDTCIHTFDASDCPPCNTRTLWNILSSCGLTLFACTWTAIHPDIRRVDEGVFLYTFRRVHFMTSMWLTPEAITAFAAWQFFSARQAAKDFNDAFGAQCAQPHGGRRAICRSKTLLGDIPNSSRSSSAGWTVTHGFFALMGGFVLYVDGEPQATLTPNELLRFVREGSVEMPIITEAGIKERSKGDGLSKCVAILQLVWFVVQLIARYTQNLPVTLLEIDTLAVVALTCIAYGLWWKKPKDVGCPYIVHWNSEATASSPRDSLANDSRNIIQRLLGAMAPSLGHYRDWSIDSSPTMIPLIIAGISGMVFGGIHCLGWNFLFPRHAEHISWRVASIGMEFAPLILFFISAMTYVLPSRCRTRILGKTPYLLRQIIMFFAVTVGCFCSAMYYLSRITIIGLMMLSLRSPPPGVYDTVAWNKFIPHVNL